MNLNTLRKGISIGLLFLFLASGTKIMFSDSNQNFNTSEIVDQQQTSECNWGWTVSGSSHLAQSFTPTINSTTKVELNLFGPATENDITISIRDDLNGEDLTTTTKTISIESKHNRWIEFDFPDIELVIGKKYYIVFKQTINSGKIYWEFGDDDPYPSGKAWLEDVHIWEELKSDEETVDNPVDFCFKTYGLNWAPSIPIIHGQQSGKIYRDYSLNISALEPNGDNVYYKIDWGDKNSLNWIGPYKSGEKINVKHQWTNGGDYLIKVKARDSYYTASDWSDSLTVSIKGWEWNKAFLFGIIENKEEENDIIRIEPSSILYISLVPFQIEFLTSQEQIIISTDSNGFISNTFVMGIFKVGTL